MMKLFLSFLILLASCSVLQKDKLEIQKVADDVINESIDEVIIESNQQKHKNEV